MPDINTVFELHRLAVREGTRYTKRRESFNEIAASKGRHFIGIAGLRGVGKSVILKQLASKTDSSLYISLDSIDPSDLFETIKELNESYGIKLFLLDEVHFCKNIAHVLKKAYDFLNVKIIFTSSVAIGMHQSAYDLSRRVRIINLHPFSLREYIYFHHDRKLPPLTLEMIRNKLWTPEHLMYGSCLEHYMKGGNMPFHLEETETLPFLSNILQAIINKDIPGIAKVSMDELDIINKVVEFIGKSDVDGISYSSVSRNLGITKFKAIKYLELLEKAFVLRRVMPAGTNVIKEPKVVMMPPFRLLFRNYKECVGGLREDFMVESLSSKQMRFYYLKSTRGAKIPDYLVYENDEKIIIEVGGKGKGREQFKGIKEKKQIIFSHASSLDGIRRPLYLAGFLA
jgi:predicted AAA+ superfamily ATPase